MRKLLVTLFVISVFCFFPVTVLCEDYAETDPFLFEEEVKLPILMYHFLTNKSVMPSRWAITPDEFENDLIYLKENGFETVFMQDVINFVYYGTPLPDKPIVLTFDDGDSSVYRYALPLLKKHNMKAVVSIIGYVTDAYSLENRTDIQYYPNLTWQQLREMAATGLVEIQNHSYDMHQGNGAKKNSNESDEHYAARIKEDLMQLQDGILKEVGQQATTFAYPFGAMSNQSDEVLKSLQFKASLSCYEEVSTIESGNPDCLFGLGRILRPHGKNPETVFSFELE